MRDSTSNVQVSKVAFTASSFRVHEDQMQSYKAYQETNDINHQTTETPQEADTKVTVALYIDVSKHCPYTCTSDTLFP